MSSGQGQRDSRPSDNPGIQKPGYEACGCWAAEDLPQIGRTAAMQNLRGEQIRIRRGESSWALMAGMATQGGGNSYTLTERGRLGVDGGSSYARRQERLRVDR
ncbi:unnamed protein product [Lampetra planeri]